MLATAVVSRGAIPHHLGNDLPASTPRRLSWPRTLQNGTFQLQVLLQHDENPIRQRVGYGCLEKYLLRLGYEKPDLNKVINVGTDGMVFAPASMRGDKRPLLPVGWVAQCPNRFRDLEGDWPAHSPLQSHHLP